MTNELSENAISRFLDLIQMKSVPSDDVQRLFRSAEVYYFSQGRIPFRVPKTLKNRFGFTSAEIRLISSGLVALLQAEEGVVTYH